MKEIQEKEKELQKKKYELDGIKTSKNNRKQLNDSQTEISTEIVNQNEERNSFVQALLGEKKIEMFINTL